MAKRKPGKYDHLLHKLKPLPPEDLEYQERVDEMKQSLRTCPHCHGREEPCAYCHSTGRRTLTGKTLAEMYIMSRNDKETLEQAIKNATLELAALEQMLIASQEQQDQDWGEFGASDRTVKLATGDSVRVQPEVYAQAKDKQAFREWCFSNGMRNKMELPEKQRNDLSKDRLLNGLPEASGIELYVRTRVVFTPMKTEAEQQSEESDNSNNSIDALF
jgi:hypothetical protein